MFGRMSNTGIAVGVAIVVVGGIIAWFLLDDAEMGESPVDEAVPEVGAETGTEG